MLVGDLLLVRNGEEMAAFRLASLSEPGTVSFSEPMIDPRGVGEIVQHQVPGAFLYGPCFTHLAGSASKVSLCAELQK